MEKIFSRLLLVLCVLLMVGCGGGSGHSAKKSVNAALSSLKSSISSFSMAAAADASHSSLATTNSTASLSATSSSVFSSSALSSSASSPLLANSASSRSIAAADSSSNSSQFSRSNQAFSASSSASATVSLSSSSVSVAANGDIQTWWHQRFEANASAPVADNHVRRSTVYDVKVAAVADQNAVHDSFVYMTIPRGGKHREVDDGADFAAAAKLTMSWSSFLYRKDVWIQIDLKNGQAIASIDEVHIRPTQLDFAKQLLSPTSIRIKVPYSVNGYKFSVEFDSDLMVARSNQQGTSGQLTENSQDAIVHELPRNALMIFAEPMLSEVQQHELVPTAASGSIFYPAEGVVNLNNVTEQIIYFKPGIYVMAENYHAKLPGNVSWVYLAPGAYVKGAFEFDSHAANYKLTRYGVLSGEKYVYAAHKKRNYTHSPGDCDGDCLRLLQFFSSSTPQTLTVQGITLNEPPFNSFVVFGDLASYATYIENYKQVGGWYYQTDGVELYQGGHLKNAFFHSNDDVLKMYHSNTTAENIVIWKGQNGPAIQFGWASRNIRDVLVKDVDVIHNLMYWQDQKPNTCIINSTELYDNPKPEDRVSTRNTIANMELRNIRAEGKNLCAMRFIALANWQSITIDGLAIDEWNDLVTDAQQSLFSAHTTADDPPQHLSIGTGEQGLHIHNYTVAGNPIVKTDNSWQSNANGRLNFSAELFANWAATSSLPPSCIAQTIDFPAPADMAVSSTANLVATASSGLPVTFDLVAGEGNISGKSVTTAAHTGLIAIAARAGNDVYCRSKIVRLVNVSEVTVAPRWIGASWSLWSPGNIPMAWDTLEKLFKAKVTLPAGEQQLKFLDTSNWSGDDWGNANGLVGTAAKTTGGGANITFSVTTAGNYTIKFNPSTLGYTITRD